MEKEGATARDKTRSLKDERGERLENKSWRASRDLADAASGKSHRSVTEEQEGEKKQSTGSASASSTPSTLFFFSPRVLLFSPHSRRQIELTPFRSRDLRFEIFRVNSGYRSINSEIYFRCHNCVPRLIAFVSFRYDRSTLAVFITPHLFALIYSELVSFSATSSRQWPEDKAALNI